MSELTTRADGLRAEIEEVRSSTLWWSLSGLFLAAFALYVVAAAFPDPLSGALPGAILLLMASVIWLLLNSLHYRFAAWALVLSGFGMNLMLISWSGLPEAAIFLALPVGLTAVLIGLRGSVAAAFACSCILLYSLGRSTGIEPVLGYAAVVNIWAAVWLVWLTSRPLLLARQWFAVSYSQSREALEESRDYQFKLRRALDDLTEANLQLTQLSRLAHDLRRQADSARLSKEQFVANVSHELRTPLNMIIGFSEMALNSPETYGRNIPQSLLADLDIVLRNSRHLASLIDDVLDLSQIDAGKMALMKEPVALQEIIAEAVKAVQPLFDSKGLSLQTVLPADLPPLYCDRVRIRQVLLNLLSNAGRFTERGGVRVTARPDGDQLIVSVADTGPGIRADEMEEIFKPFQQLDGSISSQWTGSGLGLSISKHFVELHQGRMWLESEPGQGATFFFRLPIAEPTLAEDEDMMRWFSPYSTYVARTHIPSLPKPPDYPHLLVFEDGSALSKLLARYLRNAEVVTVHSLEQVKDEFKRVPAHALLVNAASVGEDLQRMERDSALPAGLPVFVCSVPGKRDAAESLGVADYLVKPISRDDLLAVLDRLELAASTILIVDDEPDVLRLFRRMLASAERDYRVLRATSGQQARDMMRQEKPDVVLTDLIMPDMDGFQLIAEMREDPALRDVPVVVTSARDPLGQPIVSKSLAVMRGDGIAAPQLLAAIESLVKTLSVQQVGLGIKGAEQGWPAEGFAQEAGGAQA